MPIRPFGSEFSFNDVLGGNPCMVRSRLPQDIVTLHFLESAQDILEGIVKRMAHVKGSRHIRRRDDDTKRLPVGLGLCSEQLVVFPVLIPLLFNLFRLIALGHGFLLHQLRLLNEIKRRVCSMRKPFFKHKTSRF
jgi:hypothetical protein